MGKLVVVQDDKGVQAVDTGLIPDGKGGLIIRADTDDGVDDDEMEGVEEHDANLVDYIDDDVLDAIASDLLEAIEADRTEASGRKEDILKAITILGVKVQEPTSSTAVDGQHTVRSTLLLEAVLMFQANAAAELLPSSGPCKIRNDEVDSADHNRLQEAQCLENDFNHFLTVTASEYYPDTQRMLFDHVGLAGAGFKKVFHCWLRKRPASESVASENLIVNSGAINLKNADRITEIIKISQTRMKFLMAKGFYAKVAVGVPKGGSDELETAKKKTQGLAGSGTLPASFEHEIYECYCYRDLKGITHAKPDPVEAPDGEQDDEVEEQNDEDGEGDALPLPYRISIETTSKKILEIRRDWKQADPERARRQTYVKWPFIEALGFYGLGLMHILGNTATGMTAAWRILLDAGMLACFPGGIYAKDAVRGQNDMTIRVGPAQFAGVNTGGRPIQDFLMSMPYKEPSAGLIAVADKISEAARRVGNVPEVMVGEGRQDAPVGTTIALLEQATKMMAAVHKGLCGAQAEEFQLLKDLFREDPKAFWRHNKKPSTKWTPERLQAALDNEDLVPAADPNTPSHMHRVMRAIGLVQMATAFPEMFGAQGMMEVATTVLDVLGWDAEAYLHPDPPNAEQAPAVPTDPNAMAAIEQKAKSDEDKNKTDLQKTQMQEATKTAKLGVDRMKIAADERAMKIKHIAAHLQQRSKLMMDAQHNAQNNAIKALGIGTRVA